MLPSFMNAPCLVFAACSLAANSVFANGGGYLTGIKSTGPFRPVNVDNVEMLSEKLDIELKRDAALISITYQLRNPGDAVKVEMGFPCAVAVKTDLDDKGHEIPVNSIPQLEGFTLTADGSRVASKLVKDLAKPGANEAPEAEIESSIITGWQVVKLPFAAGQTRTVSVTYRNPWFRNVFYLSDNVSRSAPMMSYLFSAAALWKGAIKSGEVTVRATGIDPDEVSLSHPKRFKRDGNRWTWTFSDFEPTLQDDLEIVAGEGEFSQFQSDGEGKPLGTYVGRGRSSDRTELKKSGKWFFLSRQFTASASSSLKPEGGLTYGPEHLTGYDAERAWVEGAEGDGIGESVTLTMNKPAKATRLLIGNGYRKSADLFKKNNRVKKLGVSVNGGAPFSVELPDGYEHDCPVDLPVDAGPLKTVTLTIEEVYRGSKFRDTCLSFLEIEVPLSKAPVIHPSR